MKGGWIMRRKHRENLEISEKSGYTRLDTLCKGRLRNKVYGEKESWIREKVWL